MNGARQQVMEWAAAGLIAPQDIRRALAITGVTPRLSDWRRFLARLMLALGVLALTAGVVFFFAYNWHALDRLAKFALIDVCIVAALGFVWRLGVDSAAGKASLFAAAILLGALFALIGQTYQTGADTFELFAGWAVAILPWALVGRFAALWLLWLLLLNLAVLLYFSTMHWLFGFVFSPARALWVSFALNATALAVWEGVAYRIASWPRAPWATRILIAVSTAVVTALAVTAIFSAHVQAWGGLAWFAWLAGVYFVYRRTVRDLFALTLSVLSVVVVVAAFLGQYLLTGTDAGGLLIIGIAVIVLSAIGGAWLKRVAAETAYE